jgi:hypothetical protein
MPSVNILIGLIVADVTLLMAAFPAMIENVRKHSRELHRHDVRSIVAEDKIDSLADFIERFYSYNKVVFLKITRGVLSSFVISGVLFGVSGHYIATSVGPEVRNTAKWLGLDDSQLGMLESDFSRLPQVCFYVALIIALLVLIALIVVSLYNDLPHDLKIVLNPKKIDAGSR